MTGQTQTKKRFHRSQRFHLVTAKAWLDYPPWRLSRTICWKGTDAQPSCAVRVSANHAALRIRVHGLPSPHRKDPEVLRPGADRVPLLWRPVGAHPERACGAL